MRNSMGSRSKPNQVKWKSIKRHQRYREAWLARIVAFWKPPMLDKTDAICIGLPMVTCWGRVVFSENIEQKPNSVPVVPNS